MAEQLAEMTKEEVINKFKQHDNDKGSSEVQIALLTQRLDILKGHFEKNALDVHSKRGLLKAVSKRKRLLSYLKDKDVTRYRNIISALGLRK